MFHDQKIGCMNKNVSWLKEAQNSVVMKVFFPQSYSIEIWQKFGISGVKKAEDENSLNMFLQTQRKNK